VSEVFIVQESFASTAARLRDRYSQAVLSIDGSIQRISGTRLDRVLDDDSAKMIIASLGSVFAWDEAHMTTCSPSNSFATERSSSWPLRRHRGATSGQRSFRSYTGSTSRFFPPDTSIWQLRISPPT
jgi:hypothetical protein